MSFLGGSNAVASCSRPLLRHLSGAHRYPKGPQPKPRLQKTRSPHFPKLPLPSSGASQPHPPHLTDYVPSTSSVPLKNSSLRLHHSPPSSAPSYTTGNVPDLLSWLGGKSPRLSGEESAPALRASKPSESMQGIVDGWSDEVRTEMARLRGRGMSRKNVAKRLDIPLQHSLMIARVAERPAESTAAAERRAEKQQEELSFHKRLWNEVRARKRQFW